MSRLVSLPLSMRGHGLFLSAPWHTCVLMLACVEITTSSAVDFIPADILSQEELRLYHRITERSRDHVLCDVQYSRHGGAHRQADKPMGSKLVLPLHERRVKVAVGFRRHLDAAAPLPFPLDARLRASALSNDLQCAVRVAYTFGGNLESARRSQLQLEKEDADTLRPLSAKVNKALMPATVARIAANVNTLYMASKVDSLGWLDKNLVQDFVFGFQIVGIIPDSYVYRPIPVVNPTKWLSRHSFFVDSAKDWNHQLVRRLDRKLFGSQEEWATDRAVARKTHSEASKSLLVGPYLTIDALWDALAKAWPHLARPLVYPRIMNRFGVPQRGDIQAVNNAKGNGANIATSMCETVTTPSFFFVGVAARAFAAVNPDGPLRDLTVTLLDLRAAYRTVPTSQPWYTSVAIFNNIVIPPRTELYYLPGHNFGLASAVVNFNRFPELVVVMARAITALPVDHFYDDFIVTDVTEGGSTSLDTISELMLFLGPGAPRETWMPIKSPELDHAKDKPTAAVNTVLGVVADLSQATTGVVTFYASDERVTNILAMFRGAFEAGTLGPQLASVLRGKIFFLLSAAFGMVGRAATLPLVQRQYKDRAPFTFSEGSELHHSLLFFEALLPNLPRLSVPLSPDTRTPLLVYTDASFFLRKKRPRDYSCRLPHSRYGGALGAVVYDPEDGTVRFAAADPPWSILLSSWRTDRKTYIAELETLAAVSVYSTYPTLFAGRKVTHYVDNTVALSALVHGYSGKPDLAKPVNIFYLQLLGLRAHVYFDWVPSKANIADLPSRHAFTLLREELSGIPIRGSNPDLLAVPSASAWDAPLESWALNPRTWDTELPL